MRFASFSSGLFLVSGLARATWAQSVTELESRVVQLRIHKGDSPTPECGAGILVTPRRILTAAHVIAEALQVGISSKASGREVTYDVPGGQASIHSPGGGPELDLGVLELHSDWPGLAGEAQTPITRLQRDRLQQAVGLSFHTYHSQEPGIACKGSAQGTSQGLHTTRVSVVTADYESVGAERIRLTPSLDRSYSGSPLVMSPCGSRAWCVIGVLSERSNDAGELAALAVGLDSAVVGDFLHRSMAIELEDFVGATAAPTGWLLAIGAVGNQYVGHGVEGFSLGVDARLTRIWGFGRDDDYGFVAGLGLSLEWFTAATITSVIRSPDDAWSVPTAPFPVTSAWRLEPIIGVELFRSAPASVRMLVGPHVAGYSGEEGDSVHPIFSTGWAGRLGTRLRPAERFSVDLEVVGRFLSFSRDEQSYTLVPGVLEKQSGTVRGWSAGLEALAGYTFP